jgi:hypothetical protein
MSFFIIATLLLNLSLLGVVVAVSSKDKYTEEGAFEALIFLSGLWFFNLGSLLLYILYI